MTFVENVKQNLNNLSSGQKKAANYIMQHLESFSYATLANLSKEIGVSETTIIRLSYSLGFDSFSQMQNAIRSELLQSPATQDLTDEASDDFYRNILNQEIRAIHKMYSLLDIAAMDTCCQLLKEADKVLMVGARTTFHTVQWFSERLYLMRPEVYTVQQYYDYRQDLIQNITPSSVVFCISLARYAKWTYEYAKIAKSYGAKVIVLTDSLSSPLLELADHMLLVDSNRSEIGTASSVPLYCLFNLILSRFRAENSHATAQRLKEFENVLQNFDLFFE